MAAYKLNKEDIIAFIEEKGLKGRNFAPVGWKTTVLPMFRQWVIMTGKTDVAGIAKLSEKNTIKMLQDLNK